MGKKITIIIETQFDENKKPTGYSVEVKAGILNKQKFLSDTAEGALAKSIHYLGKKLKRSPLSSDLFIEDLISALRKEKNKI